MEPFTNMLPATLSLKSRKSIFTSPRGLRRSYGLLAGITMVTSLLSLLTDTPVLDNLGMTGELTLTGRILPVGGIK